MVRRVPKKTPKLSREEKVRALALDATAKYGEFLERRSALIYDVSALPLSKSDMKLALKYTWRIAPSGAVRDAIEVGFALLSQFQEGVGNTPIRGISSADTETMGNMDDETLAANLNERIPEWDRTLSWMNRSQAEMAALKAEFDQFKKQQSAT